MKSVMISVLLCLVCLAESKASISSVIPENESDYSIVYKCFYDHYWILDKSHHCHIVYGGEKPTRFSYRVLKLRSMFQQMLVHDRKDRQLVKHCFRHHQFDRSYLPCRGISWKQPTHPTLREARLMRLWAMSVRDKRREIGKTRFFEGHDAALVHQCLYTTEWLANASHRCHEVAYGGGHRQAEFTKRDLALQQMYREERFRSTVADCFRHHGNEKLPSCYGITWQVDGEKVALDEPVKSIVEQLHADHQ